MLPSVKHSYKHGSIGVSHHPEPLLPIIYPVPLVNVPTQVLVSSMAVLHPIEKLPLIILAIFVNVFARSTHFIPAPPPIVDVS